MTPDEGGPPAFLLTTEADHEAALDYAIRSVDFTYNRMMQDNRNRRMENIYVGKLAEGPICRELEQRYGVVANRQAVSTHHEEADRGDMLLSFQRGPGYKADIKSFRVHRKPSQPAETVARKIASQAYALVPVDQLSRPKDVYIFTSVVLHGKLDYRYGIMVSDRPALLTYPRWASRAEVKRWRQYPPGTIVYPYPRTRVANRGEAFCNLHALAEMPQYLAKGLSRAQPDQSARN